MPWYSITPGLPLQAASTASASSTGGFSVPGFTAVMPFSSMTRAEGFPLSTLRSPLSTLTTLLYGSLIAASASAMLSKPLYCAPCTPTTCSLHASQSL